MKTTFDLMRVWAALTGLALAAWFFLRTWYGMPVSPSVAMLVAIIGGFELALYGQDLRIRRGRTNG